MHATVLLVTVLWLSGGSKSAVNAVVQHSWKQCEVAVSKFYKGIGAVNATTWPPSFWDKGSARCLGFVGVDSVKGFVLGKGLGQDE